MGSGARGGRSRTQRKHFREKRENVWKTTNPTQNPDNLNGNGSRNHTSAWEPFSTQNPAFNDYYMEQGIVLPEEWDNFMEVLRTPLPTAFRVNSSSQFWAIIQSQLENDFMKSLQPEVTDEGELEGIKPLPWYPENLAWQSNYSRMQLRKNQTLERFHKFLKHENEIGNITRQEAVSMVPPLFLDVSPDHLVLDMCASPGSKTFQLLEIIHRSSKLGVLPAGMVVANDVDVQRCNLLIHQTKRMCTANLVVTNHDAQNFPSCSLKKKGSRATGKGVFEEPGLNQLLFDRVLCDVPCSGDGTLRKAPDIWRKWNVGMGNGLHRLQVKIAMRGVSILKVGGRMVYSTCSLNPLENEAVVAEILRKCEGIVELIDVSDELPLLVRRPGLKTWKIRDKGVWLASYKDVPTYRRSGIFPSMFPSGKGYGDDYENDHITNQTEENDDLKNHQDDFQIAEKSLASTVALDAEVSDLPLERSMRILPHDQNSGGFFIAVFQKISSNPVIQESTNLDGDLVSENGGICKKSSLDLDLTEASNELNAYTADTDEKPTEVASDTNLLDNGPLEVCLEHDPRQTFEENKPDAKNCPGISERKRSILRNRWRGVDPIVFLKDVILMEKIKTFYGIDESFPFDGHLVTRNNDTNNVKRIYYMSESVKEIVKLNFLVGQQLKITSIGLKMFERQTSKEGTSTPCLFRISSEGLPVLLPYITKQIISTPHNDFKHLLQNKSVKFKDFVYPEFGVAASKLMMGCCVLILRRDGQALSNPIKVDAATIAIGCWKGRASLNVMVTGIECQELLERHLGQEDAEKDTGVEDRTPPPILEDDEEK